MSHLGAHDEKMLVDLLVTIPVLETPDGIRAIVRRADLSFLLPQLTVTGPMPLVTLGTLIHQLDAFGRVTFDNSALGLFLRQVSTLTGIDDGKRGFIDALIQRYDLLVPTRTPTINHTPDEPTWRLERHIGENTMYNVAFLQRGLEASRAVALVHTLNPGVEPTITDREWKATAFLIGPSLLITNFHNLPSAKLLPTTSFQFNYQTSFDGRAEPTKEYHALAGGVFENHQKLDFTVVELADTPGREWGYLKLNSGLRVGLGDRVSIIQHPGGLPKKLSFQDNTIERIQAPHLRYVAMTDEGSSGSPVFNDQWQVIALHHASSSIVIDAERVSLCEGISIDAILAALSPHAHALLGR